MCGRSTRKTIFRRARPGADAKGRDTVVSHHRSSPGGHRVAGYVINLLLKRRVLHSKTLLRQELRQIVRTGRTAMSKTISIVSALAVGVAVGGVVGSRLMNPA